MSKTTNKFSAEVRERAVRKVAEQVGEHASHCAAIVSIASKIGCAPHTLNKWIKKAEADSGEQPLLGSLHRRQARRAHLYV